MQSDTPIMNRIQKLHKRFAKLNEQKGITLQRVRYDGKELKPRPYVKDIGDNSAYAATAAIRDALRRWEITAFPDNLKTINATTALADYDFGKWEISEDDGRTWLKVFIDGIPRNITNAYKFTLARGFTNANLTVTYQVGGGSFTTDPDTGNPIESTTGSTFYATVSQARTRTAFQESAGLSPGRVYLEGYFVDSNGEPTEMPSNLQVQRPWPATLDIGNGNSVNGTFITLIHAENPWLAVEPQRGSTCQGYFATTGTGQ